MFKSLRLKKQLRLEKELKIQEVKNQNFDSAALHREKELEILHQLQSTRKGKLYKGIKSLFHIRKSEYLYGIYIQKKETDLPIYLPFYYFSREINHYLECFFAEHPAFRFDWNELAHKRRSMIKGVTEYYFITEILDHFTRWGCDPLKNNSHHELRRDDIEDILESNVFLRIFSTPIEYRKLFTEYFGNDITYATPKQENGNPAGYYHKFQYKLPYQLKLERAKGKYVISTPFLILKFSVRCGAEERLPRDFGQLFLGFDIVKVPRIDFQIDMYIRWPVLIFPKYWKYLKTIRTLNQRLRESFSSEYYFRSFDWKSIYMQSRIVENLLAENINHSEK